MFDSSIGITAQDAFRVVTPPNPHEPSGNQPPAREKSPAFFFLRTKLLPPRPVPELLPRPRLTQKLLANLTHPVTLVTANAGSGKTTLVADFVRKHSSPFVWYQLDHTDADPFVFLSYVTNGIRQLMTDFGEITLSYLQQAADELARQPERAIDVLLNEVLEKIEQRFILVLDDYHHLGSDTTVHKMVDRLLAYLPDTMHIIIISRDLPTLTLARLRSQSSLTVINRNELLFTDEETQELFRRIFGLEITPEQLIEYRKRTHGWITALQLVRQVAQNQALIGSTEGESPDLTEILRQSETDIFDYFAEEVFADESMEAQYLLLRISLLNRVEARLCSELFPSLKCRAILQNLVRRNVFITVASDAFGEEYRLHPLFQSFLIRRLRLETGQRGLAAEAARFADHFLAQGEWETGVWYLLKAEDYERAAALIAEHGAEWITSGALASLLSITESIPTSDLEKCPRALAFKAEVLRLRGEYDAAQSLLHRTAALLQEANDLEGEAEVWHSLATIARRRGEYEKAFGYLDRAVAQVADTTLVQVKCANTRGLCLMATGDLAASEHEFRAALQGAEEQGDLHYARLITHNLGLPAMVRGDFGEALRWLRRMLRDETDAPPMPHDTIAHVNIARCYLYRGDFAACEKHLNQALECSQLFNLTALRGEIFETYGNFYRESGELARAAEFYERAGRSYEEAGVEVTQHELLEEQALLYLQAGDWRSAQARIDQLIRARQAANNELGVQIASLVYGRILFAQKDCTAASAVWQATSSYFRKHGLHYYEAQASMALAVCALESGIEGKVLEHLRRAVDLALNYDYEYWLEREVKRHSQLATLPGVLSLLPAELREQMANPQPSAEPAIVTQTVVSVTTLTDLTINMLGHVEIFRDASRPLTTDVWTTRRARDILCFVASRQHRRASKDVIIDTFWSDAEIEAIEKNFHPTISHIRKALNSNQAFKQNFLIYRDGDYQLNPDFTYQIDTENFDQLVAEGETARRARDFDSCVRSFEKAVALYRGDFLKGGYDLWMEEPRSYYREQYLRILEALADIAQKSEDWTKSIQLAQKILREDAFREDVHCHLMRAYAALGNRLAIKEQYESLCRLLQQELGVEPAAETQRLYRELFK